jgi:formylmethanofuran dehydrogenase subunit B
MVQIVDNVTCAACGCVCEQVTVRIDRGHIVAVENACSLCMAQLLGRTADEGASTDNRSAIDQAIEVLTTARAPLIYGLAQSTVETQRAAVALADYLGATIDPALSSFHRLAIMAMQSVGISTCTLGEIKQRADAVIFWGGDPTATHPKLFERFIDPPGKFVAESRHVVAINSVAREFPCDDFLQLEPANCLSAISALRALVTGLEFDKAGLDGLPREQLEQLALRLHRASYSAIFFGPEIGGVAEIESLYQLVRYLNLQSRAVVMGLGGTQCENVLTWQTGYPCGVNFALGYPRYDPAAYSANKMLESGVCDAVLIVGSRGIDQLSSQATDRLHKLSTILLDGGTAVSSFNPTVRIATALPGVHCGGLVFRMDGVPIRLSPLFASPLPTPADVLSAIQQGVPAPCA